MSGTPEDATQEAIMTKNDITKIADAVCEKLEANSFREMKEDIAN